jgi:hypothetical protein
MNMENMVELNNDSLSSMGIKLRLQRACGDLKLLLEIMDFVKSQENVRNRLDNPTSDEDFVPQQQETVPFQPNGAAFEEEEGVNEEEYSTLASQLAQLRKEYQEMPQAYKKQVDSLNLTFTFWCIFLVGVYTFMGYFFGI